MLALLLIQALTGLAGAATLFLVAAGLTVIFGVTRVVNFAHGSLAMLGAYLAWSLLTRLPRTPGCFVLGVLGAALATAAIGALLEMVLLRRLYRAPELLQLLATFAVLLIVQDATLALWGPQDLALPRPAWLRSFVRIAGARFPFYDLVLIGIGPAVLGALWLVLSRTGWGLKVRAATEDRDMLAALGVDQRWLFTSVFALGAGLAGLGGALALPDSSANLGMDLRIVTDAFVVVVVGGMGSAVGAFLAALLIAELEAFGIVVLPQATLVLAFLAMAVVLAVRPHGLLGRPAPRAEARSFPPLARPGLAARTATWAALLLAALAPLALGPFGLSVATEAAEAMLFAAALHLLMGPAGVASFGHAAWFGLGAYAAAFVARGLAGPMPLGLLAAPLLAGAAAWAFGALVARLEGISLAMLTLALAQIAWAAASQWEILGGDNGILGVWPDAWARGPVAFYLLALALCAGGVALLRRVIFSPFGTALRACRDSPARAEAIGLSAPRLRAAAFALSGAAAGLAGALAAYSKGSVFPTLLALPHSVDGLVMVLLGGVDTLAGPIVGALAYTGLSDVLMRATDFWRAGLGAVMLALVLACPNGLAGGLRR